MAVWSGNLEIDLLYSWDEELKQSYKELKQLHNPTMTARDALMISEAEMEESIKSSNPDYVCTRKYKDVEYSIDVTNIASNRILLRIHYPKKYGKKGARGRSLFSMATDGKILTRQGFLGWKSSLTKREVEKIIIHVHTFAKNKIDRIIDEENILDYAKEFCESDFAAVQSGFEKVTKKR